MLQQKHSPIHKSNLAWPATRQGNRYKTITLWERAEHALHHLVGTALGSFYTDPSYGTLFYQLRTQSVPGEDVTLQAEHLKSQAATYIPDIVIQSVEVDFDRDAQTLSIWITWVFPGADPSAPGGFGTPKKTEVMV